MDNSFADLDMMLTRIRNHQSRVYFLDAVRSYKAGALRAALTSAWVALVYDLIAKYRELSALGDAAATAFIQSWDNATTAGDIKCLLNLEATVIEDATTNTQVINRIARIHLERLREDRHLCAHPAYSAEAELFEPSAELVRLHLVNAVDLVLSQEALQGKAIFDLFDVDVQSTGFPTKHSRILDYVDQRYLQRVRVQNIRNFGVVLAKSLLKGTPPQWEPQRHKIISSLVALRERAVQGWPDVLTTITRLIDNLEPENRLRGVAFIAALPDFWPPLQEPTKTALQETVSNIDPATLTDYMALEAVALPQFRQPLLNIIATLDEGQLGRAVAVRPLLALWPRALEIYSESRSWRASEANFRRLVAPFAGHLDSGQHDQLFNAIAGNGENWNAAETDTLLLGMMRAAERANWPTADARNRFYQHVHHIGRVDKYYDVLTLLQTDGWVVPPVEERDEE